MTAISFKKIDEILDSIKSDAKELCYRMYDKISSEIGSNESFKSMLDEHFDHVYDLKIEEIKFIFTRYSYDEESNYITIAELYTLITRYKDTAYIIPRGSSKTIITAIIFTIHQSIIQAFSNKISEYVESIKTIKEDKIMANTITEKREKELKELQNQLNELHDSIQKVIDGEISMTKLAKKYCIDANKLGAAINCGFDAVLRRLNIASNDDIVQLLKDSMTPSERLINAVLGTTNEELIILDIAEEDTIINILTSTLTERECFVVKRRFGFITGKPETLEEVSKHVGVNREWTRQIESKALRKLRNPKRLRMLLPNYNLRMQAINEHYRLIGLEKQLQEEEFKTLNTTALNIHISELNLSKRSYNALYRRGIDTVDDLTKYTITELMRIQNFGEVSMKELLGKLKELGVELKK